MCKGVFNLNQVYIVEMYAVCKITFLVLTLPYLMYSMVTVVATSKAIKISCLYDRMVLV